MSEHTPGPWEVVPIDRAEHPWVIGDTEGGSIASCEPIGPWITRAEATANARLIAAAPDMLAASIEQAVLIEGAQAILTSYLVPDGISKDELIDRLLTHLDGPNERRVKALHVAAIVKATGSRRADITEARK